MRSIKYYFWLFIAMLFCGIGKYYYLENQVKTVIEQQQKVYQELHEDTLVNKPLKYDQRMTEY